MYQDIFLINIYKLAADEADFNGARKTYIGSALVPWKECVDRVKDGASPVL